MNGTKEVFHLRREGRLQDALQLARQLYAENPADQWNIKALFWSLYSVWKGCDQPGEKRHLAEEILALQVPANDQMAQNGLEAVRRAQDPAAPVISQARELSLAGNHEQAAAVLEQFLRQHHGNAAAESALAWEIWWQLNRLVKEENPPAQHIGNLVRRYAQCQTVERPSVIHSRMLEMAARAARAGAFPKFCAYLHWWGAAANIRTEDLTGQTNDEGHEFPSMVQHVIFAIGKTIEDEPSEEHVQAALNFLQAYVPRFDGEEWFPYFLGVGLCKAGQLDEALKYLVPFARTKSRDFWVWQKLAACFPSDDPRHLACLCRSTLCGAKEPEFLLTVRQQLATALHTAGHDGEARHEIEAVVALRQRHGWKISDDLARLQKEGWFEAATAKDGTELFRSLAAPADDVLMHDVPWTKALLQATGVQGDRGPSAIILVERQGGLQTVRVRMSAFDDLEHLQAGTPLSVRIATDGERKRILALQQRDGHSWDLLPETCAVVTRVNAQKGVTSLLLANGETCLAHHHDLPKAANLHTGDFVLTRSAPGRDVKHARTIRMCNQPEPSGHWTEFKGSFKPREKGGGHVGAVFVPAYLVDGASLASKVSGLAVRQHGESGDSWWVAIKIGPA